MAADLRVSVNLLFGPYFLVAVDIPCHPLFFGAARGWRPETTLPTFRDPDNRDRFSGGLSALRKHPPGSLIS
jgi:hypothetical protein